MQANQLDVTAVSGALPPSFPLESSSEGSTATERLPQNGWLDLFAADMPVTTESTSAQYLSIYNLSAYPQSSTQPGEFGPLPVKLDIVGAGEELTSLPRERVWLTTHSDGTVIFSNEKQAGPLRVSVTFHRQTAKLSFRFKINYSQLDGAKALELARFAQALARGGEFRITRRAPKTEPAFHFLRGIMPEGAYPKPHQRLVEVIEQLEFIQSKTGGQIRIPTNGISAEEVLTIANVVRILKTGRVTYDAAPWTVDSTLDQAKTAVEMFQGGHQAPMAVHYDDGGIRLFGADLPLGPVTLFCKCTFITKEDIEALRNQVRNKPPDDVFHLRLTPFGGCPIEARYIKWLPKEEAAALSNLPMYREAAGDGASASASSQLLLEEQLKQRLFEKGYMREIKKPISDFTPYQDRVPITVYGKPLSEVVVEERR